MKKFPPKGGYHRVEIAGKTGRVPGHFAITTDKRTYNDPQFDGPPNTFTK